METKEFNNVLLLMVLIGLVIVGGLFYNIYSISQSVCSDLLKKEIEKKRLLEYYFDNQDFDNLTLNLLDS